MQASPEIAVRTGFVSQGELGASPHEEGIGKVIAEPRAFEEVDGSREGADSGGRLAEDLDLAPECQDFRLLPSADARVRDGSCLPVGLLQVTQGFAAVAGERKIRARRWRAKETNEGIFWVNESLRSSLWK